MKSKSVEYVNQQEGKINLTAISGVSLPFPIKFRAPATFGEL